MRGERAEITATKDPSHNWPHAVRLKILNDPITPKEKCRNRGSGMYFRTTQEVLAAISVLRACLPVVDQLGSIADE
jgi:hypothetical protein